MEDRAQAGTRQRRLPPLPLEARWAQVRRPGAPSSELRRLEEAESEVCEANAMLVESFLNVKRRACEEAESTYSQCDHDSFVS